MGSLPFLKKALSFLVSGLLACMLVPPYAFGAIADDWNSGDLGSNGGSYGGYEEGGAAVVPSKPTTLAPSDEGMDDSLTQDETEKEVDANRSAKDDEADDLAVDVLANGAEEVEAVWSPIGAGTYVVKPACSSLRVLDVTGGSFDDRANAQLWESNMTLAQRFDVSVDEDGYCTIVCKNSGKALDVAGASKNAGTNVQQYTPNGTAAQKWRAIDNRDGTFTLESALGEGLVLDIAGAQDANGANVQIWSSNGSGAQRFVFVPANPNTEGGETITEGLYSLRNVASSRMVDVSAASLENGAKVQLYDENKTLAQMVQIVDAGSGFYAVRFVHSGKVLDSDNGNLLPGFRVQQWESCGIPNQQWAFWGLGDGSYSVVCRASGLALEAKGGGIANGTELQTSVLDGSDAQAWLLEPVETILPDGYYDIRANGGSRLVVDVSGGSAEDGANVQIWRWNGSPAQRFKLVDEDGDGSFALEALCSGLLLTQKGSNVAQAKPDEGSSPSQLWRAVPAAAGGICFVNEGSGLALDIAGADVNRNGCNVGVYRVNGTVAQSFTAERTGVIGDGIYLIRCAADRRVLDVASGSRSDGANVQTWTENGTGAQAWNLRGVGGGWFVIENARSKKALDVTSYGTAPGTNVQQWVSSGNDAQKWLIGYEGNGKYSITTACGNLALDVQGAGGYDGANVQTYTPNGTSAQRFIFEVSSYKPRDFEDCIASFSTVSTNTFNGTYNMQRALNSFNNVIIWPGQTLSFFGTAGPCGAAEGYLLAGVVGGSGYGGGICQASTTLYGASIRAGLTIVERRNHSVPSTYVPIGLDAMVDFGTSDFKARNDFGFPVKIVVSTPGNTLQADIYGIQPEWYDYIDAVSWKTGSRSAAAQRVYYKDGQVVGTQQLPSSWY